MRGVGGICRFGEPDIRGLVCRPADKALRRHVLGVPDDFGAVREPDILRCVFVQGDEDMDEAPANPDDERGIVGEGCHVGAGRARG